MRKKFVYATALVAALTAMGSATASEQQPMTEAEILADVLSAGKAGMLGPDELAEVTGNGRHLCAHPRTAGGGLEMPATVCIPPAAAKKE